ncbi:MAG TPA: hypothetical protein VHO47_01885 [Candidatus Babeliales bacterium]|nr:hypothetical protein [Candidatus Babeliales bacterium]
MKLFNALFFAIIIATSFDSNMKLSAMEPSKEWTDFFNLVGSSKKHKEEDGKFFIELVTKSKNERGIWVVSKKWEDVANLTPKDKDSQ